MDLINPSIISKSGWKRPSTNLHYIYKQWQNSPKTLNWFLDFLRSNQKTSYNQLLSSAPNLKGGESILSDFGFSANVFQNKKNLIVEVPPYAKEILGLSTEKKKETSSSTLEDELQRTREELRKCREKEKTKKEKTPPSVPQRDDIPPPVPQRDENDLEDKEKEKKTPLPPPPPSSLAIPSVKKSENDLATQLQKTKLKKTEPKKEETNKEEEESSLAKAVLARRKGIAGDEEEKKDDDDWDTSNNCIICNKISFMQCECCFNVYCSSKCQKKNHLK